MISRFGAQILVTRPSPFLASWARRQRAGKPSRWSSRPTTTRPSRPREPPRSSSPRRTSAHTSHQLTSDDAVPTPTAKHRTPREDPATASPCENANRSPPTSTGGHSRADPGGHHPFAGPAPGPSTIHHRSHLFEPYNSAFTTSARMISRHALVDAGIVAIFLSVKADGESLEDIVRPLRAVDPRTCPTQTASGAGFRIFLLTRNVSALCVVDKVRLKSVDLS